MPRHKRRSSGKAKKTIRPCTYELGYVRQDLYACKKCIAEANGRVFAFCAGCRATCHADHIDQVFELYTKRSFRCDCGNKRARNTCRLNPDKDDLNVGNERTYSHNFEGRYCRCDSEYDYQKDMAQCAMCEDWFHEECYRTDARARGANETRAYNVEYELICKDCVRTLPLLADYYETLHAWNKPADVKKWRAARLKKGCVRPKTTSVLKPGAIDMLWKPGFRINLCRCADCSELYRAASALYLTDRNDFVNVVEEDMSDIFNDKSDEDIVDEDDDGHLRIENGIRSKSLDDDEDEDDIIEVAKVPRRSSSQGRQRSIFDGERIPRKPVETTPPAPSVAPGMASRLVGDDVESIRKRIFNYLSESIDKNGGRLNDEEVLLFVSDLKADILKTYKQKLDKGFGEVTKVAR